MEQEERSPRVVDLDVDGPFGGLWSLAAMLHPLNSKKRAGVVATNAARFLAMRDPDVRRKFLFEVMGEIARQAGTPLRVVLGDPERQEAVRRYEALLAEAAAAGATAALCEEMLRDPRALDAIARAGGYEAIEHDAREQLFGKARRAGYVVAEMLKLGSRASRRQACAALAGLGLGTIYALDKDVGAHRVQVPLWTASILTIELADGRACHPAEFPYRIHDLLGNPAERRRMFALEPSIRDYCCKHVAPRQPDPDDRILHKADAVTYRTGVPEEDWKTALNAR